MAPPTATDVNHLTDQVWDALDPSVGRVPATTRRRCWLLATGLIAITAIALTLWWLSLLGTRVATDGGYSSSARIHSRVVDLSFQLKNPGHFSVSVSSVSAGSGYAVKSVHGLQRPLSGHSSTPLTVRLLITNCPRATNASAPIHIWVKQAWWHTGRTLTFDLRSVAHTACSTSNG